jgi:hypothetical protein
MKSSAMSAQTMVGTSNGCNNPARCNCRVLFFWQIRHERTSRAPLRGRPEHGSLGVAGATSSPFLRDPFRARDTGCQ